MAFVKPQKGLLVRIPGSKKRLPETGGDVDINSSYWRRRLNDGSIYITKQSKPVEPVRQEKKYGNNI